MKNLQEKIDWIKEYMKTSRAECVDIMNAEFIDKYVAEFNAKVAIMHYGANKCPEVSKVLLAGYKQGVFSRNTIGITSGLWGFPKWVYVYEVKKAV